MHKGKRTVRGMKKLASMLLAVLLVLCMGGAALADDVITVTGTATVQLQPDMAMITLGVEAVDPVVLAAQKNVNVAIAKVVGALTGEELAIAMELFCVCVKLAAVRKLMA